jgi:crotonobetainyl-CoA:carnitine CoA-transferase CaiB-like acyl-CoA transferase
MSFPRALEGVRVLELAAEIAGPLCARYLADYGADVFKAELPGGDIARTFGPVPPGGWALVGGAFFQNLNRNKRGAALDPATDEGRESIERLAREWADLVVLDRTFLGFDVCRPERLVAANPRLVICAVTPYGLTGPKAGMPATDITSLAAGGILWLTGDTDREPVQLPGQQALHLSGLLAAGYAMLALLHAEATGQGQIVDISAQECLVSVLEQATVEYGYISNVVKRNGLRHLVAHGMGRPALADGTYVFGGNLPEVRQWETLVNFLGIDSLRGEEFKDLRRRLTEADFIDAEVQKAIAPYTLEQVFEPLQALGVPVTPVNDAAAVRHSPQLAAREFFVDVEHVPGATIDLLGPPVKLSATPGRIVRTAPRLGAGNDAIERLLEEAGGRAGQSGTGSRRRSLEGVRVLDFTWVWSGPACTQLLAAHGAEVIKVESKVRPDLGRVIGPYAGETNLDGAGFFHLYNRGKKSLGLNLKAPESIEIARRLAATSDLVVENFSAGKAAELGLGYDELARENSGLVMMSLPGMGQTGPQKKLLLYGQNVEALSGMMFHTGYPDRGPGKAGVIYFDPVGGYTGAFAALVALRHARRTGQGQYVDLSMIETAASLLSSTILEYTVTGRVPGRYANRSGRFAPQGVYRCFGDERWVAISVTGDAAWRAFCRAIGRGDLADRYPSLEDRKRNADSIDAAIGAWTADREREAVVALCRGLGIPSAAVADTRDVFEDPQLVARAFFLRSEEPEAGVQPLFGLSLLSATPGYFDRPSPRLGEHTREILEDYLGYSPAEVDALAARGAVDLPRSA